MPGQDQTGPLGQGPRTGRGFGICARGLGIRQGFNRGFGFRRGFGKRFFYPEDELVLSKDQEKKILETELAEIQVEKAEIEKKLKEFKK